MVEVRVQDLQVVLEFLGLVAWLLWILGILGMCLGMVSPVQGFFMTLLVNLSLVVGILMAVIEKVLDDFHEGSYRRLPFRLFRS